MTLTIRFNLRDKSRSILSKYFREWQNVKNYDNHSYLQELNNRFPANNQCYKSKVQYSKGHKMTECLLGFAKHVRTKIVKMTVYIES